MATRSQARLFSQLIEKYQPEIRRAFMAAVVDLHANVNWSELLDALSSSDINRAVGALNISIDAWHEYAAIKSSIYAQSGAAVAAQIVQTGIAGVGVRFRFSDPNAQAWIQKNVGDMITRITAEQIETARDVIAAGFSRGDHPHTIARDIAGRVNPLTKKREGGILGLDRPRAERFNKVSVGMRTPEGVRDLVIEHRDGLLSVRYKVNKATENRILRAYRNGEAVSPKDIKISESQYHNALLKERADTIARTETANAVLSARSEQWDQLDRDGIVNGDEVIKTWHHRRGAVNERPDHMAMSGKSVTGINTPFVFPDGSTLQYPHDPNGAARHVINCGCDVTYRVNHAKDIE